MILKQEKEFKNLDDLKNACLPFNGNNEIEKICITLPVAKDGLNLDIKYVDMPGLEDEAKMDMI